MYKRINFVSFLGLCICFLSFFTPHEMFAFVDSEISGVEYKSGKKEKISLKNSKLGTVIMFLSARCPCSDSHLPTLNMLAQEFAPNGFSFVGVHSNTNETFQEATDYFGRKNLSFPVIHDNNAQIADQYKAFKTPHVFVIDPNLKVVFQGGVDDSKVSEKAKKPYLKGALLAIQRGREPADKNVRVLGCEIKRP